MAAVSGTRLAWVVLCLFGCAERGEPAAEPDSPTGIVFSGGNGHDCNTRVVIAGARNESDGVAAEYRWLDQHHPGYQMSGQSLIECSGHTSDRLHIKTAAGERDVFFDIGDFFGKL